jgi:hypothetical protein
MELVQAQVALAQVLEEQGEQAERVVPAAAEVPVAAVAAVAAANWCMAHGGPHATSATPACGSPSCARHISATTMDREVIR